MGGAMTTDPKISSSAATNRTMPLSIVPSTSLSPASSSKVLSPSPTASTSSFLKKHEYYSHDGITIYHGDCREVLPKLEGVDLVLTDPPYGVGLKYGQMVNDSPETHFEWFIPFIQVMKQAAPNVVFTHRQAALKHITDWDWLAVWQKPLALGFSQKGWLNHWEPIFVYGKPDNGVGKRPANYDVFSYNPVKPNGHPAPKPIKLIKKLASLWNGSILDPFAGSGTTLRAAKDLRRKAIGIEIEEKYCEIAAKRLEQEVFDFADTPRREARR